MLTADTDGLHSLSNVIPMFSERFGTFVLPSWFVINLIKGLERLSFRSRIKGAQRVRDE